MGVEKRYIFFILGIVVGLFILYPSLLPLATTSNLTTDGDEIVTIVHDNQSNFNSYLPSKTTNLPTRINLDAKVGQSGHISYGILHLADGKPDKPWEGVGVKLKLNQYDFTVDEGVTRIGLATMWKEIGSEKRYYVEFDLWHNPAWQPFVNVLRYNYYQPWGEEPTVEIKTAQLMVGEVEEFKIPCQGYFDSLYPGVNAELDGVYLVINKNESDSAFTLNVTLMELWLYPGD